MFGHEPLSGPTRATLAAYAEEALAAGRYDFQMGRKLRAYLETAAFTVARFNRMKLLRDFCGPSIDGVQEEFLGCLARADHRSTAKVYCCIATVARAR